MAGLDAAQLLTVIDDLHWQNRDAVGRGARSPGDGLVYAGCLSDVFLGLRGSLITPPNDGFRWVYVDLMTEWPETS